MSDEQDADLVLAEVFAQLARSLSAATDPAATLRKIVELAVTIIDGCEHAGISLVEHRRVSSWIVTDPLPAEVDRLQSELGQGPCLDAIREHELVYTPDLDHESRWPEFSSRAHAETGMTSVLSLRLFAETDTTGALNLYSTRRDAFDVHGTAVAVVFAAHAGVALAHSRRQENLEAALETRDVIGQAKGILMSRLHLSDQEAFDQLRVASQHLNVRLRDLAEEVVYTGEPPADRPPTTAGA